MSYSACSARIERIREEICRLDASAMYVRSTANIAWATAFEDVFDEEQAHALLVFADNASPLLHTDSRYITAMQREARGTSIQVDAEVKAMSDWARDRILRDSTSLLSQASSCRSEQGKEPDCNEEAGPANHSLAIEDAISLHEYRALEKAFDGCPFKETHDLILKLRAVKDSTEIARLKAAQSITDAAFSHIIAFIKPGLTERDVQLELDDFMLRNGASGLAFPTIIASGANGASPHAIVSDKPLQAGECIVMDFGARRAGYCSDMTRTVFLGEPEGKMRTAWDALREANEHVEHMLRPGITGRAAHEAALSILDQHGFGGLMGHGLGHGVGIEIHELPVLSPRNEAPLELGNVVTVEPGIYIPEQFGMRLEDFGVITDDSFEVFTASTHDMVVL